MNLLRPFSVAAGVDRLGAANIPHARPHLLAEEGHFSVIDARFDRIVDDLLSRAPFE